MNITAALAYRGYNAASQTVSELSAINAPTRPMWMAMAIVYCLLVIGFGRGVWLSGAANKKISVAAILLMLNGFISFFWPPMHQRQVIAAGGATWTDTMHLLFAAVTVLLMILTIGFGAAGSAKGFRTYSIITLVVLMIFGLLTALDSPKLQAGLPTPMLGIWERINIGVYLVWIMVFATNLLKKQNNQH